MGESVTEGTVLEWLKQVGDRVEADEPLVEVSTDKVDAEVPAPAAGTLVQDPRRARPDGRRWAPSLGEIEVDGDGAGTAAAGDAAAAEPEAPRRGAELVDVAFPEMGDSVAEGTVLEWRKQVGDAVAVDDTARGDLHRQGRRRAALARGRARSPRSSSQADETVAVGTVAVPHRGRRRARRAAGTAPWPRRAEPSPAARPPAGNGAGATPPRWPRAWRAPTGSTLDRCTGSGPRGRVTKEDVLAAVEGNGAPPGRRPPPEGATSRADPRPGGHARPLHGREPLDPHRHQLPHAARWTCSTPAARS